LPSHPLRSAIACLKIISNPALERRMLSIDKIGS
jgi:hypothetical protein